MVPPAQIKVRCLPVVVFDGEVITKEIIDTFEAEKKEERAYEEEREEARLEVEMVVGAGAGGVSAQVGGVLLRRGAWGKCIGPVSQLTVRPVSSTVSAQSMSQ